MLRSPDRRRRHGGQRGPYGALLIGEPPEVVEKIIRHSEALGGVELLGAKVAPTLRQELAVETL